MEPIIHLNEVRKSYFSSSEGFEALKGINLEVERGEYLGVIGKSGAGKTTLINLISGVDRTTSGEVWVNGMPVHNLPDAELALWRGLNLGIIYQSFHLMPSLSLIDNVILPMDFCGLYHPLRSRERAELLLSLVGLADHMRKFPAAVSGGQQQRIAIARALANDPPILIADEPTGRLDSGTAEAIFQIFDDLILQGKTIIMVTHDHGVRSRFSRVLTIADGHLTNFQGLEDG